eukprot:scaffold56556_cov37-Cyclotella_meneghiniana.AAC.2
MYSVFGKDELSECEACSMVSGWLISPSSAISLRRVPRCRVAWWGLKAEVETGGLVVWGRSMKLYLKQNVAQDLLVTREGHLGQEGLSLNQEADLSDTRSRASVSHPRLTPSLQDEATHNTHHFHLTLRYIHQARSLILQLIISTSKTGNNSQSSLFFQ